MDNIKCRDELMAFFFGLLSVHYFLKAENTEKKVKFIFKMIFFLFLALLCKKTALLFAGFILLAGWFFTGFDRKKILYFFLLLFCSYVLYVVMARSLLGTSPEVRDYAFYENPLFYHHNFFDRINAGLVSTGYYARLLLFPYPLCFYYGYNAVAFDGPGSVWFWFSLVFYGTLIFYLLKKFRKKDLLSFSIFVFLMGLAPFSNFVFPAVGILDERFIYFSSLGFCMALACLLMHLARTKWDSAHLSLRNMKPFLRNVMIGILVVFSGLVIARNTKWKDLRALSENDVKHYEESYMLHVFLANKLNAQVAAMPQGYMRDAVIEETKKEFAMAGEILRTGLLKNEEDYFSMTVLGTMYSNYLNKPDEAMVLFRNALKKKPKYETALYNLYYCYQMKGYNDSAIYFFEKMVNEGTNNQMVFLRLHELYTQKGAIAKAIASDKRALQKHPEEVRILLNLGNDYILANDTLQGVMYFEKATQMAPGDYNLNRKMSEIFNTVGNRSKALEYSRKADAIRNSMPQPDKALN